MPKGTPATADQIAEMRRLRTEGKTLIEIASAVGINKRSVGIHTADLRDTNKPTDSGRDRLLRTVAEEGPFETVDDLGKHHPDIDLHSVMHLLYSLGKAGLIRFRESKNGSQTRLVAIEATKAGFAAVGLPPVPVQHEIGRTVGLPQHAGDRTDFRTHGSRAEGGPITSSSAGGVIPPVVITAVAAPAPLPDYPLIRTLRNRRIAMDRAAKLLELAGKDELALAVMAEIDDYTPIEQETLALFAAAVEAGIVTD